MKFTLASVGDVGIAMVTFLAVAVVAASWTCSAVRVVALADSTGRVPRTVGPRRRRHGTLQLGCVVVVEDLPLN